MGLGSGGDLGVARAAQAKRDWPAALAAWSQVVGADPGNSDAWLQCGRVRREMGDCDEALSAFRTARELAPDDPEPLVEQAGTYERMLDWPSAARLWRKALSEIAAGGISPIGSSARRRAHLHLINMERLSGRPDRAKEAMAAALEAVAGIDRHPEFILLKAQIERTIRPAESFRALAGLVETMPARDDVRFDAASLALEVGEYQRGSEIILPSLRHGQDESFFRLAIDLYERRHDWNGMLRLFDAHSAVRQSERLSAIVLKGAIAGRELARARRLSRDLSRRRKLLDPIHDLARAYERTGDLRRARLLSRFLMKAWPHSDWHRSHYIRLVARSLGLPAADKAFRALFQPSWTNLAAAAAYSEAPFFAGEFSEAVRRIRRFLVSHPNDTARPILLGYALANAEGIDVADRWFEDVSCESFQSADALTGLAHMAMRRRDAELTRARWVKLLELYPANTIAKVEYARSLYELRDTGGAIAVADRQLAALPTDVTMREFRLWLYSVTGDAEKALEEVKALIRYGGPSWTAVKHGIRNAVALGRFDVTLPWLLESIPPGTSARDGRELYEVARELIASKRSDMLGTFIEHAAVPPVHAAWAAPYLAGTSSASGALEGYMAQSRMAHARVRNRSRVEPARVLNELDADGVRALIASAENARTIHIVNKFEQPRGGSELHALDLAEKLARVADVRLWAPDSPHPGLPQVMTIDAGEGRSPKRGVIVLVGIYFEVATWIGRTHPDRIVILYNTFEAPSLYEKIDEIFDRTGIRAEIVFCADIMQAESGIEGLFEPSPTDLDLFHPVPRLSDGGPLRIGRHSRDVVEKHDYSDGEVYRAIAARGGVADLLGGTCMRPVFGDVAGLNLLPARSHGIAQFLQGLDIFFYRTSTWIEPWGRVIIEAMACGLPCVVDARSGAAQIITNGYDGFIVRDTGEAIDAVVRLMESPELRRETGSRARERVERLLGSEAIDRLTAFYLLPA